MKIALFLEDAGHLEFIGSLVARISDEEHANADLLGRNAAGGRGTTVTSLRNYLQDVADGREEFAEIVVVAIDGNCVGWQRRVRDILEIVNRTAYAGRVVCAVPDPHVEIWYLADGRAAARVAGAPRQEPLPAQKCEPNFYKDLLREAFLAADIDPPAGGTEFGSDIARELDIARARRSHPDFNAFVDELIGAIRVALAATR